MSPNEFGTCILNSWSPLIGDPTFIGWLIFSLYLIACVLSVQVFRRQSGRQRTFWLLMGVALFALALNKQLDLQYAFTAAGRCLAQAQGWYDDRRAFQFKFIVFITGVCLLVAIVLFWAMRKELSRIWLALIGVSLLLTFIAVRAVSFHHVDQFLGTQIGNVRVNWMLEIGGIAMIGMNALYLLARGAGAETSQRR